MGDKISCSIISGFAKRSNGANGKSRKYYSITAGGKKRLTAEKEQWQEFTTAVNKVIGGENYALS